MKKTLTRMAFMVNHCLYSNWYDIQKISRLAAFKSVLDTVIKDLLSHLRVAGRRCKEKAALI
jgi:hypothetical protein